MGCTTKLSERESGSSLTSNVPAQRAVDVKIVRTTYTAREVLVLTWT
jgi:hypothetical protein